MSEIYKLGWTIKAPDDVGLLRAIELYKFPEHTMYFTNQNRAEEEKVKLIEAANLLGVQLTISVLRIPLNDETEKT